MAEYTLKNIKDIPDMAEKFGLSPGLEARFARDALELTKLGVSYLRLAPDFRARLKLDDDVLELHQWDAVRIPSNVTRNFEAGPEGAEVLAIGAPKTGLQDAEQLPGWWDD